MKFVNFINYPSIDNSKSYFKGLNELKSSEVKNTYYKNTFNGENREIKNNDLVNKLLKSIKDESIPKFFFIKSWVPKNTFNLFFETETGKTYRIRIIETETDLTIIKLIYRKNNHDYIIGQHVNYKIKDIFNER